MVISQIAGLATAFGTGELSGAGFGPNYTILMKLGYEFYAPRILEEMEKNPNIFFQDTMWFQKFQKQIKLYSDKVMEETLDTLLHIPQKTINAIDAKFGIQTNVLAQNLQSNVKGGLEIVENIQSTLAPQGDPWAGWNNFWNAMANRIPNSQYAFAEDSPPISTTSGITNSRTLISLTRIALQSWSFTDLNNAMSAITKNNSPYDGTTQGIIRDLWNKGRTRIRTTQTTQRQTNITQFQNVKIPTSNIPPRSTKRPAGQSVKIERIRLIKQIARLGQIVKSRQNFIFKKLHDNNFRSRYRIGTTNFIKSLKTEQQKLTFLLNNYTF